MFGIVFSKKAAPKLFVMRRRSRRMMMMILPSSTSCRPFNNSLAFSASSSSSSASSSFHHHHYSSCWSRRRRHVTTLRWTTLQEQPPCLQPKPNLSSSTFAAAARRRSLTSSSSTNHTDNHHPNKTDEDEDEDTTGEEVYQKALQALHDLEERKQEQAQETSQKMYEAWKKHQQPQVETNDGSSRKNKSQGVQVVKTLVQETRKEKKLSKGGQQHDQDERAEQEAQELLKEAALIHHHPLALVQWGNLCLTKARSKNNNTIEKKDHVEMALDCFQKAGEQGSRVGWFNVGQLYWTGFPELEPVMDDDDDDGGILPQDDSVLPQILKADLHVAMDAFTKAIDLGDTDAMYLVGVHRMTEGGRENIYSGLKLIERAGEQGHSGALYYLALLYLNGEPNIQLDPCSDEEFRNHLDMAVEAGSIDARYVRANSLYHGTEGYTQSYVKALQDFLQAAEEGHADAAVSAGAILFEGRSGIPRNEKRAFDLYQAAGELGSKEGWQNVVACYMTGQGVPKSVETARYIAETMLKDTALVDTLSQKGDSGTDTI